MEAHKYLNNFLRNAFCFSRFFLIGVVWFWWEFSSMYSEKKKTEFGFQELGQFLPFGCYFSMLVSIIRRIIHQLIICKIRSRFTTLLPVNFLRTMSYVSLLVPLFWLISLFVWKKLDAKNISEKDLEETEAHVY